MKWLDKLSARWKVTPGRAVIILIVFACTGFTVYFLKKPVLNYFAAPEERTWLFSLAYWILIFPIYNLILLSYGFLFGQFRFFWEFEKRMFRRLGGRK